MVTETVVLLPMATLIRIPPLCFVESGSLSQRLDSARSNFHSPLLVCLLAPEAELLDQGAVALEVLLRQIVEQPAAAADELEQSAARIVILRVRAEMVGELVDAGGQEGDLHLRGPGVGPVPAVLPDDVQLGFLGQSHVEPPD